jgi:iron complex outermembrane receptor protein
LPPQGTQGQLTDPSVIPAIALARVEVVADGSSAIYGSDAIGGVVNFILRKNFDGAEFSARSGFSDQSSYDEQQLAGIFGHSWDGGWGMVTAEYTRNSALYASDLPWYQANNLARGGRDLRGNFCNPGTITAGGGTYAIPPGGATSANVGTLVRGTSNRCFYNSVGHSDAVFPEMERVSVLAALSQDIGSRVRVFADGFYSHRDGVIPSIATATATVPRTNPFFVSPVAGATSVSVTWSLFPDYGPVVNPYWSESWNAMAGIEADIVGDVKGTFYYSHGESEDVADRRHNGINAGALTGCARRPQSGYGAQRVWRAQQPRHARPAPRQLLRDHRCDQARCGQSAIRRFVDGNARGNLRFAAGAEYRKEYTFTDLITGTSASQVHVTDAGSRNVKALFGELYIPIFGAGQRAARVAGVVGSRWLAAGRNTATFGETTNPKIGLTYEPISGFRLQATYGTSFRAPTFTEVSTIAGGAGLYFDTLPVRAATSPGIGVAGGNPSIQPETATTWSVGAQLRPLALPGLNAQLTYFDINYKNQIQALRGTPGLLTNPIYASFVNLSPTPAQITALRTSGLPINNPSVLTGNVQFIADGRRQNLGESKISGLDFVLSYDWDWGGWNLDAGINGSYFLTV